MVYVRRVMGINYNIITIIVCTHRITEFVRHAVRKSGDHFHSALPLFEITVPGPRLHVESHFGVFA